MPPAPRIAQEGAWIRVLRLRVSAAARAQHGDHADQTWCLSARAHSFLDNFKLTRRKGTIVSVGNASGAVEPIAPLKLVEKNLALLRPT